MNWIIVLAFLFERYILAVYAHVSYTEEDEPVSLIDISHCFQAGVIWKKLISDLQWK